MTITGMVGSRTWTVRRLLYVGTGDKAIGINAGLYIAGHVPMLLIQNNDLYACMNTVRTPATTHGRGGWGSAWHRRWLAPRRQLGGAT